MRLQKFLADNGIASRRKSEELILDGKVIVNGKVITELGTKVDPNKDKVFVDGKAVETNIPKVYYLLNKPAGYTTTTKDPHAKHTVLELVPSDFRVFPVGRLDKDSTGFLIITNDGEFTNRLTHPRYEKEKEYQVVIRDSLSDINKKRLENGVIIDDKKTSPAKIRTIDEGKKIYSIIIREGRNRQIRKMIETVGNKVIMLKRVRMASLALGDLKEGKWRKLTPLEVKKLISQ